jgi:tetratricopeptide (TPR) repeat protein
MLERDLTIAACRATRLWVLLGIGLSASLGVIPTSSSAGIISPSSVTPSGLLGANGEGIPEVEEAIRSYVRNELDQCFEQLKVAVARHPELPPAPTLLAMVHILQRRTREGRVLLDRVAAEDPSQPEVYLLFGELALADGRLTDALLHYQRATSLARPARWTESSRKRFDLQCHLGLAAVAEGRGDWASVKEHLTTAVSANPRDGRLRQTLARARFELNETQEVYPELRRAARDDSALDPPPVSMMWLYAAKGDQAKAAEWAARAASEMPKDPRVHMGIAVWTLEQDQPRDAQKHIETALALDPKSRSLRYIHGLIARHLKDFATATRTFEALCRETPDDFAANDQLALTLADQDDASLRARALALAEAGLRQHPDSAAAATTLGWAYFRVGRVDEAERVLRAAISDGGADSEAAYHLARVLSQRGRRDDAKRLLARALAAPGRFVDRAEAKSWLIELERSKPQEEKPR